MNIGLDSRISDNTVLVVASEVISSDLNDEVVILNINDGTYYGLDEVGYSVWMLLQEPKAYGDVRSAILDEYDVDAEQCEQDLQELIGRLIEQGLIEVK